MLGEGSITTAGGIDLKRVNNIAREMVYRCGFSKRLGPVALMDNEEVFIGSRTRSVANIGTELAAIAYTDIQEVCACLQFSCSCNMAEYPSCFCNAARGVQVILTITSQRAWNGQVCSSS